MTERPILFSAPMVRALLDGRKTQTRRVLASYWQQRLEGHDRIKTWFAPPEVQKEGIWNQWAESGIWAEKWGLSGYNRFLGFSPYRPGDRLWVRESGQLLREAYDHYAGEDRWRDAGFRHTADGEIGPPRPYDPPLHEWIDDCVKISRPSIHMPRWASRLTLIVSDVRVQRLQDISEEDAIAEGVTDTGRRDGAPYQHFKVIGLPEAGMEHDPIPVFSNLWEFINGPGAWKANPWVAAYTFYVQQHEEQGR